jgi:hypothetical protein
MPMVGGPEDVFGVRPARCRWRARALAPLLGAALRLALTLLALHMAAAHLPGWPGLTPALLLTAAVGGAMLMRRLDRAREVRACPPT